MTTIVADVRSNVPATLHVAHSVMVNPGVVVHAAATSTMDPHVYLAAAAITAGAVILAQLVNGGIVWLREHQARARREQRVKQIFVSRVLALDSRVAMVVNDRMLLDPEQIESEVNALREILAVHDTLLELEPVAIQALFSLVGTFDLALPAMRTRFTHVRANRR